MSYGGPDSIYSYSGEMPFYEQHQESLASVFEIVGISPTILDSLDKIVNATQPWVAGDHSRPEYRFNLSALQKAELAPFYKKMGMVDEMPIPAGHYSQVVVLGAIHQGNNHRLDFLDTALKASTVTVDKIVLLGGQRTVYPEREKVDIEANLAELQEANSTDPWVLRSLTKGTDAIQWETDMLRLAGIARLGGLSLKQLHLRFGNQDPIKRYEFETNDGTPVSLLHTPAVPRPNGKPRHTTEACIIEWAKTYKPNKNDEVVFVGANPHLNRMIRSSRRALLLNGCDNIKLLPTGPSSPTYAGDSIYLGEIARSLYEDQQVINVVR